jgi:hypothetical protein
MSLSLRRVNPQPILAVVTSAAALFALGAIWIVGSTALDASRLFLAGGLVLAFVGTRRFPANIRSGMKLYLGSVPLYLMAALLAPPLAVTAAMVAKFTAEWSTRRQRGLYRSDIATDVARISLVSLAATVLAHAPALPAAAAYVAAAAALFLGDILTSPLVLSPIMNERPQRVVVLVFKDAAARESLQYLAGVAGALIALDNLALFGVVAIAAVSMYGLTRLSTVAGRTLAVSSTVLSPRLLVAAAVLALNLVGASIFARPAAAAPLDIGPCRTDPVVLLSNGGVVIMKATINTAPSNLQNVTYTIHAPSGTTITHITYTGNATNETVNLVDDSAAGTYDTVTDVSLASGTAGVSASTQVASLGSAAVTGSTSDHLTVHIGQ